ncbi:uncharacterized protein LOC135162066 [Diachasmimorpha longicaudata]|uniref:uncharacterized protein LOC135162066 n=1 Tax=Diachasmimorpha longicaudata TaxID=58733 RepID=UPI0030B86BB6
MKNHMDRTLNIPGNRVYLIFLLLLSTLLNNAHSLDLTIDNRLLVVPPDCYTRVSIGSRLVDSLVISTIQANAAGDCEAACSTNGTSCGSFSFGVGNRGNGSCVLGSRSPQGPMDIQRDPNYDVYGKGKISLRGCQTTVGMPTTTPITSVPPMAQNGPGMPGNGVGQLNINSDRAQRLFGNNSLLTAFENSVFNRNRNNRSGIVRIISRPTAPFDFMSDDQLRTSDILHNKKNYRSDGHEEKLDEGKTKFETWSNEKSHEKWKNRVPFDWQEGVYNLKPYPIGSHNPFHRPYYNNFEDHNGNSDLFIIEEQKFGDTFGRRLIPQKIFGEFPVSTVLKKEKPQDDDNDYVSALDDTLGFGQRLTDAHDFWIDPSASIKRPSIHQNDVPDPSAYEPTNEVKACFRRLLSGKRIIDSYVKRVMECERLLDCHRMCEYERGFTCEGFNYRPYPAAKGMCELVSMPPSRVDVNRDFITDPRYDYYERDWTRRRCESRRDKLGPDAPGAPENWWGGDTGGHRPGWTAPRDPGSRYIPPGITPAPPMSPGSPPYGGTFVGQTKLTFDVPRPTDHDHRHPDPWLRPGPNDVIRPTHRPQFPARPLEDNWRSFPQTRSRPDDFHQDEARRSMMGFPRYLPSRPSDAGYSGNGYSYGRPGDGMWMDAGGRYGHKYPMRRIGYTPDPATNEVSPHYIPDRAKPPKPDSSERYGPSYGRYPYDSGPPKSPIRPLSPEPSYPKTPLEQDSNYGPLYSYGGAYGYSGRPVAPKISPAAPRRDCSVRSAGGFRLARGIIRKSYLTANLGQCESLCQSQKEFTCLTFAYRYNLAATAPSDNCLLSDAPFENLVFYTDLEPDRDYDIYAMAKAKWCETHRSLPSTPRRPRPPDECFWRVRTGFGMPPSVVKKPTRVEGMGKCQVECVRASDFTCRSFVFRYDSHSVDGLPNCYLSDWPAVEMDPHKMQDMDGAELYERGSFGRGCEPRPPIHSPDPSAPNRPPLDYKPSRTDEACYAGYDRPCKLTPYAIILTAKVSSEADCRRKCTVMRENTGRDSPPCMSFSYKISGDFDGDNCHMSDVPTRDLRPGLDYTHDENYSLYVFKELEPKCSALDDYETPSYSLPTPADLPSASQDSKPYDKPVDPYYHEINVPDHNKPGDSDLGYHYPPPHTKPSFSQDERFFFPPELTVFNHYTVNGHPCKRGTKCERHPEAGFWSCQTEDSEPDSWDYCCEPSHQCGFSQGFKYPWCYVGASTEQWRPCSEWYFPYSSKPTRPRPSRPISPRPHFGKCEYEVECGGRHWPVAVLHGEAPPTHGWETSPGPIPNGTDSVALANNHDHRKSNDSAEVPPAVKSIGEPKNGTNSSTTSVKKRRTEEVHLLPLKIFPGSRASEIEYQRANSRFKLLHTSNSSLTPTSRDADSPQFYITKRLNAALSTPEIGTPKTRGAIGKIERIERPKEKREENQRLVTVTSRPQQVEPDDVKIHVPIISVVVSNATSVIPNSTKHWVRMETISSETDQSRAV